MAEEVDHQELTRLTMASKAYWGYDALLLSHWKEELTISPAYIRDNELIKLMKDRQIIGYYAYRKLTDITVHLDNLFVLPEYIGNGIGKILIMDMLSRVKLQKYGKVLVDADPNAEGFYARFGFMPVGKRPTIVVGRFLPIMEKRLI